MPGPIRLGVDEARASQALIDAYAASWQRIADAQQNLIDNPLNARKRARLNELADMVGREIAGLDDEADTYVRNTYPQIYANAVAAGANAVEAGQSAFTQVNQEAAQRLATGLYTELLEATAHVDATTKALIRQVGRDAALRTAIDGKTARQAATEMRRILNESGIHAVTYANGTKMGLKGYAEMAIRTSTALALNEGAIQGSVDAGCLYWEIFDGPTCGWVYHDDPELANGKIVSRDDALAYPISHPNCRRAVGPRPDLGVDTARAGQRSTTAAQDAEQVAADEAKGRPVRQELAARADRAARGVVPRAPRAAPGRSEARIQAAMARRDFPSARKTNAGARQTKALERRRPAPVHAPTPKTLLERYADGEGVVKSTPFGEGQSAQVHLLELDDGTKAIMKTSNTAEETASEVAAHKIARGIGARTPDTVRIGERTILQEFVEDVREGLDDYDVWSDSNHPVVRAMVQSEDGHRLGLLDTLLQNRDRHYLNWLQDRSGRPVGIDHGADRMDWMEHGMHSPPFSLFADAAGLFRVGRRLGIEEWLPNSYTKADWATVRDAVRSARGELESLKGDSYNAVMDRLDGMAAQAQGKIDRIAGVAGA